MDIKKEFEQARTIEDILLIQHNVFYDVDMGKRAFLKLDAESKQRTKELIIKTDAFKRADNTYSEANLERLPLAIMIEKQQARFSKQDFRDFISSLFPDKYELHQLNSKQLYTILYELQSYNNF